MTATLFTVATDLAADHGVKLHHATRAKALRLASCFAAEYPALALYADVDAEAGRVTGWSVEAGGESILDGDSVPELADVLDAAEDAGVDPTEAPEGEEDEPQPSGSVVPEHYRALYRTVSSNGQTCGDWLAEWLVAETTIAESGTFSVGDFTAIAVANDLDMTALWARLPDSGQKGWVGRYRMNGRQALERQVAVSGILRDARGAVVAVPETEMARLRGKHAKLIARLARKAAADLAIPAEEEVGA